MVERIKEMGGSLGKVRIEGKIAKQSRPSKKVPIINLSKAVLLIQKIVSFLADFFDSKKSALNYSEVKFEPRMLPVLSHFTHFGPHFRWDIR